jgi:hypothetical protein
LPVAPPAPDCAALHPGYASQFGIRDLVISSASNRLGANLFS